MFLTCWLLTQHHRSLDSSLRSSIVESSPKSEDKTSLTRNNLADRRNIQQLSLTVSTPVAYFYSCATLVKLYVRWAAGELYLYMKSNKVLGDDGQREARMCRSPTCFLPNHDSSGCFPSLHLNLKLKTHNLVFCSTAPVSD